MEDTLTKIIDYKNIDEIERNYKELNKKITVFWGNHQKNNIEKIILTSEKFCNDYLLIHIPEWNLIEEHERTNLNKLFPMIEVFIYQEIENEQYQYDLLKIIEILKGSCKKIVIPDCYFKGYHPQVIPNVRNALLNSQYNKEGVVPYGDKILEESFLANISLPTLEKYLYSDDCITVKEILKNLSDSFVKIKDIEKRCNIYISDYIEKYYKCNYLFLTPSHPTNFLLSELARRILNNLNIKEELKITNISEDDKFEVPIYPIVSKTLDLSFTKETYYFCRTLISHRDTILGYALKYRQYCFPELREEDFIESHCVDIGYKVILEEEYLEVRRPICMTYNMGSVHLALYLTIKKEIPNLVAIKIPKEYVPKKDFIALGMNGKTFCPLHISCDGTIRVNMPRLETPILIVDTIWNI